MNLPDETHRILSVSVDDGGISWKLEVLQDDGKRYNRTAWEQGHPLSFDEDGRAEEAIQPLVNMQRWLGDLLADRQLQSDKAPELAERLSDLAKVLGQHLYTVLFKGQIHECLLGCLTKMPCTELLRIEIEFNGKLESQLSSWPWEYLYIPRIRGQEFTGVFLAQLAQLVLTRRLYLQGDPPALLTARPVKVLFVRSAPHDEGPVSCEPVLTLVRKLKDSKDIELIELIEPDKPDPLRPDWAPEATVERFEKKIKEHEPHVIHFAGHGQTRNGIGLLAFVGLDGKAQWINNFASMACKSNNLKLVFLQACESALADPHSPVSGVALSCAHARVPAVVAMQAKIQNGAANLFACRFYEALAQEKSIDYAVKEGREALNKVLAEKAQPLAFGVPVLYLRSHGSLIGPKTGERSGRKVDSQEERACPRCKTIRKREDQNFCTECELSFYCKCTDKEGKLCGFKLDDPLGKVCGQCGGKFIQPEWQPTALEPVGPRVGQLVMTQGAPRGGDRVLDVITGSIRNN